VIGAAIITPATQEERREEDASHAITEGRVTPPVINDAIAEIENFEFNPSLGEYTSAADRERIEEEAIATALIMFSPTAAVELPKLRTDTWHYGEKEPNPISIGTARKLLATAYAEIPCELEAAGDHGYAWIIEPEATWTARGGVQPISAPTKPKEVTGFDMRAQWEYSVKSKRYTMYKHLAQEGRTKIMEWFGKAMFHDLFKNDALPPTVTPSDLLAHIEATYATPSANRICMEEVEDKINGRYDTKQAVEAYFMQLQDARTHAKLLGVSYTDQQIMNKALKQFELRYEKDAYKAEKKWNERDAKAKTWSHFKKYWKEEVHQWNVYAARSKKKQAHHAVDVESIMENVSALRAEAVSLKEYNANLTEQLNFHNAMQAERSSSGNHNSLSVPSRTTWKDGWIRSLQILLSQLLPAAALHVRSASTLQPTGAHGTSEPITMVRANDSLVTAGSVVVTAPIGPSAAWNSLVTTVKSIVTLTSTTGWVVVPSISSARASTRRTTTLIASDGVGVL
jgi:hypothetical protein